MARARAPEPGNGGLHMHGMERPRDAELDEPGPGRRIGGQRGQLILGAGSDDLAAAIVVGSRQTLCCQPGEHIFRVTADDGRHRGWGSGAGLRHGAAALAYEDHRLLGRQHTDSCRGGDFADRVTRNYTDEWVTIGWMREQFERGEQAGGDQERLGNRGVSDGLGVGFGAVMP